MQSEDLKVRIIVRRDLSPQQQLIQACHAVVELVWFGSQAGLRHWVVNHKTLVVFGVADEIELRLWESLITATGIDCHAFYESDMAGQMTALAVHPDVHPALFTGLELL